MQEKNSTKYIFVSGGVLSGLGKGVTAASLGYLLQNRGYKVTNIKCENYLNLDSSNINPVEHGDVFLCEDGTEADLDLGTYERFLNQEVGQKNYTTIGQIYQKVICDAQNMKYRGATVEAIPHIPEEVIRRIENAGRGFDIALVELGGTAGEYQNIVYFEAYRIMKLSKPADVIHVHVTYFPKPDHINELKSKPTQLSVKQLQSMGIQPDFIVGRSSIPIDEARKEKVAYFCNLSKEDIISNPDLPSIYELPLEFSRQDFDVKALEKLQLTVKPNNLKAWQQMVATLSTKQERTLKLAIVVDSTQSSAELRETYASLLEALKHASTTCAVNLNFSFIKTKKILANQFDLAELFGEFNAVLLTMSEDSEGHLDYQNGGAKLAVKYAREHRLPFLAIGNGLHFTLLEYISNAVKNNSLTDADLFITGELRRGGFDCQLTPGSLADRIYGRNKDYKNHAPHLISERHRHRSEFNMTHANLLTAGELLISGISSQGGFADLVEFSTSNHPFFLATSANPEYKSRPLHPHPLFVEFLKAGMATQSTS